MATMTLRDRMKGGTFSPLYRLARQWKRRLRHEPAEGNVPMPFSPMSLDALLPLASELEGQARYHFSLALAYLDNAGTGKFDDESADYNNALACLERAETLHFEAADRLALYIAVCRHSLGQRAEAQRLVASLPTYELTETENALRARLL